MRPFLQTTVVLGAALALAGCDAADRAALAGLRAPTTPAAAAAPTTASASAALLFPPAAHGPAPRLRHAATAHRGHSQPWSVMARRHERVRAYAYAQRTVTRLRQDDGTLEGDQQLNRRLEAEQSWDARREAFAEGYGPLRAERSVAATGRDRDGYLTWPGKVPDRR